MAKFTELNPASIIDLSQTPNLSYENKVNIIEQTLETLLNANYSQRQAIAFYREAFQNYNQASIRDSSLGVLYNTAQAQFTDPLRGSFVTGLQPDRPLVASQIPNFGEPLDTQYIYIGQTIAYNKTSGQISEKSYAVRTNELLSPLAAQAAIGQDFLDTPLDEGSDIILIGVRLTHVFQRGAL